MARIGFLVLLATLSGCGEPAAPPRAEAPAPPSAPAPVAAPPPAPDDQAWKILAPSPLSLEKEVKDAGVTAALADLVPKALPPMPPIEQKDRVAFRTGVVFAYALLGGRTTPKPEFLAQLRTLREGMAAIGTGQGLLARMDKAVVHVENDTASRDDFLIELDGMITSAVPEEGWGPNDTTGPLLQAGAWLAGMNIVAQAVVRSDNAAAADKVLRHPEVATFFLGYIKGEEGAGKAGGGSAVLVEALTQLQTVANQPKITVDDAKSAVASTQKLLQMF